MRSFSERLIKDYEEKANLTVARICRIMMFFLLSVVILNLLDIFIVSDEIYPAMLISILIMFVPTVLYNLLHLNYLFVRYIMLTLIVLMTGLLYSVLSYHVVMVLAFPTVISCVYSDKKSVIYASALSVPVMAVSHLIAHKLKIIPEAPIFPLYGVIIYEIVPRTMELMAISIICSSMAEKIQNLIRGLAEKNDDLYSEQEILVTSLAEMIEAQSHETGKHVKRVAEYTKILCEALHMSEDEVWLVSNAAALHDVGKIMIPQEIINKPGKLTKEEFEIIKMHVQYGKKLLEKSTGELMRVSADIAYQHHERYDGTGYMGMKGEDINLYARCVSVADVFDALVSRRTYKEPWDPFDAKAEIISQRGKQFDPHIVDLFEENFDKFLEVLKKYPDSGNIDIQ